jgi:hypothetical protein
MTNENGQYDIHIEIDIDCEELVDATGLDYTRSLDDDTQNVIIVTLNKEEWNDFADVINDYPFNVNEVTLGAELLNPELGEYVTKVTIYKPTGDVICYY